ncbi:hypothetical protein Tco_0150808 [Tanacetum coccineum]
MSSLCLVMNRVGSIEPFENPLDSRKCRFIVTYALWCLLKETHFYAFSETRRISGQDDMGQQIHLAGLPTLPPSEIHAESAMASLYVFRVRVRTHEDGVDRMDAMFGQFKYETMSMSPLVLVPVY